LCDLLGIKVPIIGAPFGPWDQVTLAAAVSEAGGLGSVGSVMRPAEELREQWQRLKTLTDRPFAINHTGRPFDREVFDAILDFGPPVVSFHLAAPGGFVERAHDAGALWMQQVMSVEQASRALDLGADVIVAQGSEAGGHGGSVSTMVLVRQVVEVAGATPVVAAGGIADGGGLLAALAMGAQAVSMGTRFVASTEFNVNQEWKKMIVTANAEDAVKTDALEPIMPLYNTAEPWHGKERMLRTAFMDTWEDRPVEMADVASELRVAMFDAIQAGNGHEYSPFVGQSVGLIADVVPVAQIIRRTIAEAEDALSLIQSYLTAGER
jgi:nitronate monooxygenase/enoyl-[acyl-carrier protein] reductase II